MPTWTWIIDSEGQKLSGGYDFTDAYNGGNSIRFYGNLSAGKANRIMLYSTKVTVESGMKLGLTYKGGPGPDEAGGLLWRRDHRYLRRLPAGGF